MEIVLTPQAKSHIEFWKKSGNHQISTKIKKLMEAIIATPFEGIGKPEALKHNLSGYWSRRINDEHRIIYKVEDDTLYFISCKGHH